MKDIFYPSTDGKTTIHAVEWLPEGEVKGVLQIVHGMAEYASRYAPFAEFLASQGYIVCGEDHLGHGSSVCSQDDLGYFTDGNCAEIVLADIRKFTELQKEKYQGVPYFIMGHSMGSFFTRKYISVHGDVDGAIIMGTGFQPSIATGMGKFLAKNIAKSKGWHHRSKLINDIAFGSYNNKTAKRTEFDWLSVNEDNVNNYIADPLCGIPFTCSGFYGLFSAVSEACSKGVIGGVRKDMPVFIVSGKEDPVGGYSKGVIKLYNEYNKCGMSNVSMTLYENARHEILNDNCAKQVYNDVLEFLNDSIIKD